MTDKMIAYCGLICSDCGAFLATQNNDDRKREEVAALWSRLYGAPIRPQDINCQGCLSDKKMFSHCRVCEIRKCAQQRNVKNCAHCPDCGCEKLEKMLQAAPEARKNIEKIKSLLL